MDFGRVEISKLDQIDFKLPKEPYFNNNVLKGRPISKPKFYVGLSSWGRKELIGKLYPRGTKEKDFKKEYSRHFNAIELNSSHYKLPSKDDIDLWLKPFEGKEFVFCPKVYQGISHMGSLNDKAFLTDVFLKSIKGFSEHLGAIFLQVSDKFSPKRKDELFNYLTSLPKEFQFFLEVRHPDWFIEPSIDELFLQLKKLNIGAVIIDTAGRRDVCHMHITKPSTFIRFVANGNHPTDFKRIDDWAARIKYWIAGGLERVYFFLHCLDERYSPELSRHLIHELNEKCEAGLKEIEIIS